MILLIGAPAPAASAQTIDADRPGVLYAGSVLPAGRLQLEVGGFEVTRVADSTERSTLLNFPTVVRVGLGRQLEIQVGHTLVNRLTTVAAGRSQRETGLGDLALGLKFARAASGARPGIVIAGGAVLPTGERPFSSEDPQLGVQGQALWSIGRGGSLGVLGGYARTAREGPDAANATLAVSIAAPFGHAWSAYVEAAALPIFDAGPTVAFVGGGITRIVGQRMQLDLFLNRGLTSASMDWTVGGGVAVRF